MSYLSSYFTSSERAPAAQRAGDASPLPRVAGFPLSPVWINRPDRTPPDWLRDHLCGDREPNGSFMIRTQVGGEGVHMRVLPSHAVFVHRGTAHYCDPDFVPTLRAELEYADTLPPRVVGPGKAIDRCGCSKAKAMSKPAQQERKRAYPEPIGDPPTIEWVKVDKLSVDAAYQRSTDNHASQRLIASIAASFDWRLCAPLVVSRRPDGSLTVIDGQHRTLAAKRRGDIPHLPCCVFAYSGPEEEARMFIAANRSRKPMNRLDDFYAAIAAADDDAIEIQRLVTEAGLTIARNPSSTSWKPGEVAFIGSIATALRKHDASIVSAALTNLAEAFPDQRVVQAGSIFLGLVRVFAKPPEGFDPDRLFAALLKYDADGWGSFVTDVKGGDTRAAAIHAALLMAYEETPAEEVAE